MSSEIENRQSSAGGERDPGAGVGTGDLYRGSARAPATAESYGLAPGGFRLPRATRLGAVGLQVGDLERSLAFYERVLGMRRLDDDGSRARLAAQPAPLDGAVGPAGPPLVELHERRGIRPAPRSARTGLFHFALLLPDRPALGRFLAHAERLGLRLGAGDHLVSESLYLHDPDGLGIEVYADRPSAGWRRVGRQLMMATDPLDLRELRAAGGAEPWTGLPPGTVVGHLHLRVGDLERAAAFYSEGLGFDRTVWDYPGALFLGAGGYHHHLGTNTWAGPTAEAPSSQEPQLLHWTIELPDRDSLDAAAASLERAGFESGRRDVGGRAEVVTQDPWGTRLRLRLADGTPAPGGTGEDARA